MDCQLPTFEQEVLSWPGVTPVPGQFGAGACCYAKRETGHIHRRRIADLPVTKEIREDLLARGCAVPPAQTEYLRDRRTGSEWYR